MCYYNFYLEAKEYNFYLEAKENLILATTTNEELNSFTLQEKGWSYFFRGIESLIRKK